MADTDARQAMADFERLTRPDVLETLSREELYTTIQTFLSIILRQQENLDRISGAIDRYVSDRDREKLARMLADSQHKGTA